PHRRRIAGAARASQCEGSELASTSLNLHQSHELRYIGSVFDFSLSAFPFFSFQNALPSNDSSFNQT
ncbi:MAG: hypothetical protein WA183_11515, partial [Chthoniobacterales bacterium]